MTDIALMQALGLGLVLLAASICAQVFRATRISGWPVLGGLLAGFILGPVMFGGMMPSRYEAIFVGGEPEIEAYQSLIRRKGADLLAAREAGADAEGITRVSGSHEASLVVAREAIEEAQWSYQTPLRALASACVVLVLLGASSLRVQGGDRRQGFIAPLTIGIWAAMVPGGLVFAAARWLWDFDLATSMLVASAVAVGPWALKRVDVEAADQAEIGGARMIQHAGRVASMVALAGCGWALWTLLDPTRLMWTIALLALPLSWLLPSRGERPVRAALEHVLVPSLAALVTLKVDFLADFHLWTVLVILLLDADGRWLGAVLGAVALGGRRPLRTMRLVLGSMACGPTMLAVAAVGVHTGALPGRFALALALGAGLIEITTPWRRIAAQRILETELELEEIAGSDSSNPD